MKSHRCCALCHTQEVDVVAETDRDGNPLRNVICNHCGLVWVDPRPSEEAIARFYSEDYRTQYKGAQEPKMKHCYRETQRAIKRLTRLAEFYRPGDRVLDVGAGAGFFAYVLKRNDVVIDGVEPNRGYADFARDRLGLKSIRQGYLSDCDKPEFYDIITIHHVFEHLPDPQDALGQMKRLLKPGGKIILEVPNIEATYHAPNKVFHLGHLYWYNPETISRLVENTGFRILSRRLVPATDHINLVIEKRPVDNVEQADLPGLKENSQKVKKLLSSRNLLKHYLTVIPYRRFFGKLLKYLGEWRATRAFEDKIKLIESIPVPPLQGTE